MIDIYGTIGPACADVDTLKAMFEAGMTGMRLNTSHISVREAAPQIDMIHQAAAACGVQAKLLIDMQGPELRIGRLTQPMLLETGSAVKLAAAGTDAAAIPVPDMLLEALIPGVTCLLDDGKLLLQITGNREATVLRGGSLHSSKSIALQGVSLTPPAMTRQDKANLRDAVSYGVTGVMQPFVRSADDLRQVKQALAEADADHLALLAKIETMEGVRQLETFFGLADEIVIARGDLGNAMPLWELPRVQKDIGRRCRAAGVPFMVVTQMLSSMEHCAVPTRAEVSDIYNAVCDGAASVMVTGETAVGDYPAEVIRYLTNTVYSYQP